MFSALNRINNNHIHFLYCIGTVALHSFTLNLQAKEKNEISGDNALHVAVRIKDTRAVTLLLRHDADSKMKNHDGKSALDLATEMDDKDIIELLSDQSVQAFVATFQGRGSFKSEEKEIVLLNAEDAESPKSDNDAGSELEVVEENDGIDLPLPNLAVRHGTGIINHSENFQCFHYFTSFRFV